MDELQLRRLKHNELVFRAINDERERSNPDGSDFVLTFLCECSDPNCTARIRLAAGRYAEIRGEPNRFIILPGHDEPRIETVVETRPEYEVVEKRAA